MNESRSCRNAKWKLIMRSKVCLCVSVCSSVSKWKYEWFDGFVVICLEAGELWVLEDTLL